MKRDEGARSILRDHDDRVRWLACEDPGIVADIDTSADLRSIIDCIKDRAMIDLPGASDRFPSPGAKT